MKKSRRTPSSFIKSQMTPRHQSEPFLEDRLKKVHFEFSKEHKPTLWVPLEWGFPFTDRLPKRNKKNEAPSKEKKKTE